MVFVELLAAGEGFWEISVLVLAAHVPVMLAECVVSGAAAGFLMRNRPEMLDAAGNFAS